MNKRTCLLVTQRNSATLRETIGTLCNPYNGKDCECKRGPVNEGRRLLVGEDGPEGPGNDDGGWEITLGGGESICCCGALEEEEGKKDKDLGPDARTVSVCVDTECLESGENDEDCCPTVVQRKGEVDEEFIAP